MAFNFDFGLVACFTVGRFCPRGGQRFPGNGFAMQPYGFDQIRGGAVQVQVDPILKLKICFFA